MGIGITSNCAYGHMSIIKYVVSIPNGDRHYLELQLTVRQPMAFSLVSIPNGDRHYLEPAVYRT